MRLRLIAATSLLVSLASFSPATGAPDGVALGATRIHPAARLLFAQRAKTGHAIFPWRDDERFLTQWLLPVIVRFRSDVDAPVLVDALAKRGVIWTRPKPIASGAWLADVSEGALDALEAEPGVLAVAVDLAIARVAPLEASRTETRSAALQKALRGKDGTLVDGKGVTILDVDGPIFQFHPAFFHADAGAFTWTDVDGDGKLTPNKDGVDLDGDGTIATSEVLRPLQANGFALDGSPIDSAAANTVRVDRDYLFLDLNGNLERDYGATAGFDEATPAYGEPIFIVDDANKNGALDPTERLLRLGKSKIAGIYSKNEYYRGDAAKPLVGFEVKTSQKELFDAEHATAVGGIMVGGVSDHSRLRGLAPGADLLSANHYANPSTVKSLQWGADHGANVIITEYTSWIAQTLDGSAEDDRLLDALNDKGIVTVSPAGNLGGSNKHKTTTLTASAQTFPVVGDRVMDNARYAMVSVHHKSPGRTLTIKVTLPNGTSLSLPSASNDTDLGGGYHGAGYVQTTARGTIEQHAYLWGSAALGEGNYTLSVQATAGASFPAEVYLGDDASGWSGGFTFATGSDDHTLCTPSTSDKTITVAAYVLHGEPAYYPDGEEGDLAGYSSRGPVVGQPGGGIEIAAPANPLAPTTSYFPGGNSASFGAFGGTSGAGPHVAASAALLRQLFAGEKAVETRTRLLTKTRKDGVSADETRWGKGKLDVLAAAGEALPKDGPAPKVTLTLPEKAAAGKSFDATVSVEDDEAESAWKIRWDSNYDGVPDGEWKPFAKIEAITPKEKGPHGVRVEILDGEGNVGAATARIDVGAKGSLGDDDDDDGKSDDDTKKGPAEAASEDSGCRTSGPPPGGGLATFGAAWITLAAVWLARARRRTSNGA